MNLNPLRYLFPGHYARKEANEQRQALREAWREEQRMDMARTLMNPGRRRR